jgi:hypothetical protein
MKKAIVVKADDWEGLFIDGGLTEEGHTLNQGEERVTYFIELARTYEFTLEDIIFTSVTDDYYEGYLSDNGSFPTELSEVELEKD